MKTAGHTLRTGFRLSALSAFFLWSLTAHAHEATNRVGANRVFAASKVVKAQSGADGTIHLLFDSDDGPRYSKSQDGGLTFSAATAVVDVAAQKPGLKFSGADLALRCRVADEGPGLFRSA